MNSLERNHGPDTAEAHHFHSRKFSAFIVPLLAAAVFLIGVTTRGRAEVYPFANWAMFSNVPERADFYTMLVHEVDGRRVSPPAWIYTLPEFGARLRSGDAFARMKAYYGIADWAGKGGEERHASFEAKRNAAEALLGDHAVTYELLRVNCNPLYFYRDGQMNYAMGYGVFESGASVSHADLKRDHRKARWVPGATQP